MICTRLWFLSLALLVAGCGSEEDGPELAPVNGVVKYQGQPLKGATVTFAPKDTAAGGRFVAIGSTNENGQYELKIGARTGAKDGAHFVAISAPNPDSPIVQDPRQARMPQTPEVMREASLIPLPYSDMVKSGLSAEVKLGETNVFDFNLTEDGTGGVVTP